MVYLVVVPTSKEQKMNWRKSSFSVNNGQCVEVSDGVHVRDTADSGGTVLTFPGTAWAAFTQALRRE